MAIDMAKLNEMDLDELQREGDAAYARLQAALTEARAAERELHSIAARYEAAEHGE